MPPALKDIIEKQANAIRSSKEGSKNYIDPSWGALSISDKDLQQGVIRELNDVGTYSFSSSTDLPPGYWTLISAQEISRETITSPKLTKTQWGQNSPWNIYSDNFIDQNTGKVVSAPAGCGPVAMAQYVYFTHMKDGMPSLSHQLAITTPPDKMHYWYRGINENFHWNEIALKSNQANTKISALLIGYIASCLNAKYGITATSVTYSALIDLLSSYYDKKFVSYNFDRFKVRKCLESGYPVFITSETDKYSTGESIESVGHAFLIDQYQKHIVNMEYTYGWVRVIPDGMKDHWKQDLKDENGNIIKYAYTNTVSEIKLNGERISMNWGWDGSYNRIFYTMTSDWNAGGYSFYKTHKIYLPQE